jgi:hypothetical protein
MFGFLGNNVDIEIILMMMNSDNGIHIPKTIHEKILKYQNQKQLFYKCLSFFKNNNILTHNDLQNHKNIHQKFNNWAHSCGFYKIKYRHVEFILRDCEENDERKKNRIKKINYDRGLQTKSVFLMNCK